MQTYSRFVILVLVCISIGDKFIFKDMVSAIWYMLFAILIAILAKLMQIKE